MPHEVLLEVKNLGSEFTTDDGIVRVLDGVTFNVKKGQTLGIVGESGCGKSVTAMSIMGLLPHPYGRVYAGEILYRGKNVVDLPPEKLYQIRGNCISMIFQDPMTALNPVHSVGKQLCEVLELHRKDLDKKDRLKYAIKMLDKVGIPSPELRVMEYPHNLSGGMRQRVMIAIALACKPDILICDEPTTALDVTVQAQILDLMRELQRESGMAIIFITHDLGVVAEICDDVVVMYAGRVVETADIFTLFEKPKHPYTKGLLNSMPTLSALHKQMLVTIPGNVPHLNEMPAGCRFCTRCAYATDECRNTVPAWTQVDGEHKVSCHHWKEVN
ncbi:ABC transporter ATP-binding protein [Photobacterium profundum]|uniref:ABC-type dipeptide transporter n=1 Tax=Photobacterium profundum (strain SS9) TaxID=298386 RepID=Q6LN57_PHOPR|nr:ABC transporter ATP-binding protein [Photobacterium profundum]CAG21269.1 ABC-type dipeptide/oligopeptide/nickel transport system, ATPase component [Photobacterium profundum SS9]